MPTVFSNLLVHDHVSAQWPSHDLTTGSLFPGPVYMALYVIPDEFTTKHLISF